jgi:hypothetical protein
MSDAAAKTSRPISIETLVQCARLQNINVVGLEASREHSSITAGLLPEPPRGLDVNIQIQTHNPAQPSAESNAFLVTLDCVWVDTKSKVPLARVRVQTRLAYTFTGLGAAPSVQELAAFADGVAVHHAWPFLRERVMTLGLELQMPPVILPIRRLDELKAALVAPRKAE